MAKVYCRYCKHSESENVCRHPSNMVKGKGYYGSRVMTHRQYQSEINNLNTCSCFSKRSWLSQKWYNLMQYE